MPNTSYQNMQIQGGNWAVILPAVFTNGQITSLGTAVKHEALESTSLTLVVD
jgi:hypothetical protein